jgi:hypothetical protein
MPGQAMDGTTNAKIHDDVGRARTIVLLIFSAIVSKNVNRMRNIGQRFTSSHRRSASASRWF